MAIFCAANGGHSAPTKPCNIQRLLLGLKETHLIRKISSGEYRLYSRKVDPKTQRRRNLGTFKTRAAAEQHEREVQYFKRH
jgi:hypothetical protein